MTEESEKECVPKIVAATVREILGDLDPNVSVKTLAITGGVLGVTRAAKEECDDGTWILADTGAAHEPVGLMKGQQIPASNRPCKLQLAIGHVEGRAIADGLVCIVSDTELPSIFPICRLIAECNMSWTLNSTGGVLVGDNGERSHSLPFIHENKTARLRSHRKQCLRENERKTTNDTSWIKGENVCVSPARVLDSEEPSDHEKGGHLRKVGNFVPCAVGCGTMRSHFRLDPTTKPGGCLSVDIPGPHVRLQMIHSSLSFWAIMLLTIKRILQKKSIPSCPENTRQLSGHVRYLTLVVCARKSRWRVTTLAMETALMNLRIIWQEVSGSTHIR